MNRLHLQWLVLLAAAAAFVASCTATAQDGAGTLQAASTSSAVEVGHQGAFACMGDYQPGQVPPAKSFVLRITNDNANSSIVVDRLVAYAFDGTVLCDSSAPEGSPQYTEIEEIHVLGPHSIRGWGVSRPCMNRPDLLGAHAHVRVHVYWSHSQDGRGVKNPPSIVSMLRGEQLTFLQFVECTPIWVHP